MKSHLLIGAASSGSGKTTFTLGLLRALKNRYGKVRPFKCSLTISTRAIIKWPPVVLPSIWIVS